MSDASSVPVATPDQDERNWAAMAHWGSFIAAWLALGFVCPLIVMLVKTERPFPRRHSVESLNFQLFTLILAAVAGLVTLVTLGLAVIIVLPLAGVWLVYYVIAVIMGGVAAQRGDDFRYPLTLRLIK